MDVNPVQWRKASRSTDNGGDCVELADVPGMIAIRDSKDPHGPELRISHSDFRHLAAAIKDI